MKALTNRLRRFRDQEDGLVMTEFLIMLPLLLWTFMALFVYWDAFRTINLAQKAAFSVADLVSRQSSVDMDFINGLQDVTEYLMNDSPGVRLRVTSVQWDADGNRYYVIFSRSPGNAMPQHTNATISALAPARIPLMADNDSIIIVETEVAYDPAINVGIPNHTFDNFVVTRPRIELKICMDDVFCPAEL